MDKLASLATYSFYNERILPSLQIIEAECKLHPPGAVALSYNGGKDCTVILELLELSGLLETYDCSIVNFAEEDCFEELQEFIVERLKPHEARVRLTSRLKCKTS